MATGPHPDLMWLVWALPPLELSCGLLQSVIGSWALVLAGTIVVALVAAIAWSTGGQS